MAKDIKEISFQKDDLLGGLEHIKRHKDSLIEYMKIMSEIRRAAYENYLKLGFSSEEALELCKRPLGEL